MMRGLFWGPINVNAAFLRDMAVVAAVFVAHASTRFYSLHEHQRQSARTRFAVTCGVLVCLYFLAGKGTEFIYFQF
jgi:hypothetical protein